MLGDPRESAAARRSHGQGAGVPHQPSPSAR